METLILPCRVSPDRPDSIFAHTAGSDWRPAPGLPRAGHVYTYESGTPAGSHRWRLLGLRIEVDDPDLHPYLVSAKIGGSAELLSPSEMGPLPPGSNRPAFRIQVGLLAPNQAWIQLWIPGARRTTTDLGGGAWSVPGLWVCLRGAEEPPQDTPGLFDSM